MKNEEFYIDFDGVIVDTQKQIDYLFELYGSDINSVTWNNFLRNLDWENILNNSKEIDNSLDVLRELYKLKKEVYILSRVFSTNEVQRKIEYLRDNKVYTDFITVPERMNKSSVVIPNPNRLLVDDSEGNINDWKKNNGNTLWIPKEEKNIKCLLKRL